MRKWTAAAVIPAVLMSAGGKGRAQGTPGGGAARAGAAGEAGGTTGAAGAGGEETVPGGFTVDTQKVANPRSVGQTVNEPD